MTIAEKIHSTTSPSAKNGANRAALSMPGLVSLWRFQEAAGEPRRAEGPGNYALQEMAGSVARVKGGILGPYAAKLETGQWFSIPRQACPALDIHGSNAEVTVVAWIQRHRKPEIQCEFVAGIWNETRALPQYGLFLDLRLRNSADQVGGHISAYGGPTPGSPWCLDAAIGRERVSYYRSWHCVGFTYDGTYIRSFHNGSLDARDETNPYRYPHGIFYPGESGGDFTVGAVDRLGEMGNWFTGLLGGLAVYRRALNESEMRQLAEPIFRAND